MAVVKVARSKVPEALAKKRARYSKLAAKNTEARAAAKKDAVIKRRNIIAKARKYAAEYANDKKVMTNQLKAAKKQGNFYVADSPRLAVVTRIRGINQISPKPKKVLKLLRLRQIGNTVFVRLNHSSIQMLRMADPFITWGYPTQETISKMIYKRGAGNLNGQRIKLSSNATVEKGLGHLDINCIEDLIHEIYTVGKHFKEANNWLFPVKLSTPRGGWKKITNHFIEGGDFGNREEYINALIKRMN
jgi:large subunit ribosomal protein L7e